MDATILPTGKGKNKEKVYEYHLERCDARNCKDCFDDYKVCLSCQNGFKKVLDANGAVKTCSDFTPNGYGLDLTNSNVLRACAAADCSECPANYQVCSLCDVDYSWTSHPADTARKCFRVAELTPKYSKLSSNTVYSLKKNMSILIK